MSDVTSRTNCSQGSLSQENYRFPTLSRFKSLQSKKEKHLCECFTFLLVLWDKVRNYR